MRDVCDLSYTLSIRLPIVPPWPDLEPSATLRMSMTLPLDGGLSNILTTANTGLLFYEDSLHGIVLLLPGANATQL
jgi:hypothetical protein